MTSESTPSHSQNQHPVKGILLIAAAFFLFACMDACTKYLTQHYEVPAVVAVRYLVHLALMLLILAPRHSQTLLKIQRKGLVIIRGATLAFLSLLIGIALHLMPIAETTAICFLAPIIVVIFASFLLHERVGVVGWIAVMLGFMGVLMIVRPGSGLDSLGIAVALLAALTGATYQLLSRVLASTEKAVAMLFYTALIGAMVFGLALPWYWNNQIPASFEIALFLFMGASGGFGHYLFNLAYQHATASTLAPVTYVQLLWAVLIGWIFFDTTPDSLGYLGMSMIVIAGLMITLRSRFVKK